MRKQIETMVQECDICSKAKSNRHLPYGQLKSLPVPMGAWKAITFNFIVKLPLSKDPLTRVKYDLI